MEKVSQLQQGTQKQKGPITAIVIGAGSRGREAYGYYALKHPDRLRMIAIADPNPIKRKLFQQEHGLSDEMTFEHWDQLLNGSKGKIADVVFVCTPDLLHFQPAMRALELDYDVVLEKPISPSLEECRQIAALARKKNRLVQVCHVLRFSGFWNKVKEIVDSGRIGKIIHYDHSENVSYWHFGHSFVRGIFRNEQIAAPLILAKTCHDLDLMAWIMGRPAISVQSTGHRSWYRPENAPPDAPERCLDGCPHAETCPWYAPRMYITADPLLHIGQHVNSRIARAFTRSMVQHPNRLKFFAKLAPPLRNFQNWQHWPATSLSGDLSIEGKMKAMRETSFGKCIFRSDNDVVDHQISTFTFPEGVTGTLTVHGMSDFEGREIRIFGSKGSIRGYFRHSGEQIIVTDFRYSHSEVVYEANMNLESAHGGADTGLMNAFTKVMLKEATPEQVGTTDIHGALESHYMGFAAEQARHSGKTIELASIRPKNA